MRFEVETRFVKFAIRLMTFSCMTAATSASASRVDGTLSTSIKMSRSAGGWSASSFCNAMSRSDSK